MKFLRIAFLCLAASASAHGQNYAVVTPKISGPPVPPVQLRSDGAAATPLAGLVEEAERNNPEILAAQHGWRAAENVPQEVSALPETQLFVQQFNVGSPRPFAGYTNSNFAYVGIGGSQDIPYPGKRALRTSVAEYAASALHEGAESVRRRVVEMLKLAYYRLAYIQQTFGVLRDNDQLLKEVEQQTESRYGVGQGSQQDVLKAQLQHSKILQEITMHHQDEGQLEAQIKQVLNRPQASSDIVAEPLTLTPLQHSDAELMQLAQEQNPDVRARSQMVHHGQAQVDLAHKEFLPDFNMQYEWERTDPAQFRAYYVATFGIRLPNRRRQDAELAEAKESKVVAEEQMQSEIQRVLSETEQQCVLVRASEERLKIYREGLIPQSQATFQAGLAGYGSNREDFESLLGSFLDVLNLNLQYRQELVEHESALARLQRLTGVALP
jgi:cobalt-zinc-cadmium efflux system outer membrane protein